MSRKHQKKHLTPTAAPKSTVNTVDSSVATTDWRRLLPLAVMVAGALAYLNSLAGAFVFDDGRAIEQMAQLQSASEWWGWIFRSRRVTMTLSLAMNYQLGGEDVVGYHLFNLTVHLLAGMTLFGVVRRTLLTQPLRDRFAGSAHWLALGAAAIWVVHPLNTQAVTYIIQRGESMMGLFYLLTMYGSIRLLELQQKPSQWADQIPWALIGWAALTFIFCLLGMVSKEVMATAPLMVIVYDRIFTRWSLLEQLQRRGWFYPLLFATYGVFALGGLKDVFTSDEGHSAGFGYEGLNSAQYLLTQTRVVLKYIKLGFWPSPLVLDYLHPGQHTLDDANVYGPTLKAYFLIVWPAVVTVVLVGLTVFGLIKRRPAAFLGAWFFGALSVSSTIIPIADLMVEHRMYLSLAAQVALAVIGGYLLLKKVAGRSALIGLGTPLLGIVILVFALMTAQRNREYAPFQDQQGVWYTGKVHIWTTVTQRRPTNPRGWHNLGSAYDKQAALVTNPQLRQAFENQALRCYDQVLVLTPTYDAALNNIAQIHLKRGHLDVAEQYINRAIAVDTEDEEYRYNLGEVYLAKQQWENAIETYQHAIALRPDYANAYNNLGIAQLNLGRMDEALASFQQAYELDSKHPLVGQNISKLSIAFARSDRFSQAIEAIDLALVIAQANGLDARLIEQLRLLQQAFKQGRLPAALNPAAPRNPGDPAFDAR